MKMRKLFAGLAAAATLLGGLALGASTANADTVSVDADGVVTSDATFKFTADDADQWKNREVKYYKLADYVRYDSDPSDQNKPVYGVQTAVTADRDALEEALKAAIPSDSTIKVPDDTKTDLMAWALQQGALDSESKPWTGSTRLFADSLAHNDEVLRVLQNIDFKKADGTAQTGTDRTVNLPAGVYLFVDVTVSNGNAADQNNNGNISNGTEQNPTDPRNEEGGKVVTQSAPIVLASGTVKDKTISDPLRANVTEDKPNGEDNTVAFKNHVTPVVKAYDDKDGTVSVGQTVNYTLKSNLPAFTTGFKDYQFALTDTPGVGQNVNLTNLQVKVDGKLIGEGTGNDNYELKFSSSVTADEQNAKQFTADGVKTFILDFSKYVQNHTFEGTTELTAGVVEVKYQAVINDQATPSQSVVNSVEVNDNNSKAQDKTKLTTGEFAFTKTDAQGNPVKTKDAKFQIYAADENVEDDVLPIAPTVTTAVSDENGKVSFTGLADGVYKVSEIEVPNGFVSSAKAEFKVTIKDGHAVTFEGTDFWGLAPNLGDWHEGSSIVHPGNIAPNGTEYKVKNVKNITQLPLTGAAGTVLFTVVGLLLAGAAATVYMKSRSTRRALRA
ncbi:Cna protein B-type domain-containing protein [Bifidobacterium hapali]|uniref:Cna protein B-type domain-containing protein n=1 Tax=Bifidobacterium hapali TaxID=1630172 RepID=A0A261G204_9BIFI|nr:SpaA isopeptide-forming pilin-related protein [Bifidobacterium hapali]OZG65203.1 Cna protein B-type domain-containing protein [Bifidobacterium hapali]